MMNDVSARDEEFYTRYERFRVRVRELRGLRVNQFLGILDKEQQRRVVLIEKELEDFVRKYGYSPAVNPAMQESILVLYNSDIIMRRRIEQRIGTRGERAPLDAPRGSRRRGGRRVDDTPDPPDNGSAGGASPLSPDGPAPNGGPGERCTGFFLPTEEQVREQTSLLMGGRRISGRSLETLCQALRRRLGEDPGASAKAGTPPVAKMVRLRLTDAGKVSIEVANGRGPPGGK